MQITDVPIDLTKRKNQPVCIYTDPPQLHYEGSAHQPVPSRFIIKDNPYTIPSSHNLNISEFRQPLSTSYQEPNQIEKLSDSCSINQGESSESSDSSGTQVGNTNEDDRTSKTIGSKRRTSNNSDSSESSADSGSFDRFEPPTDIPNSDYSPMKKERKVKTEVGEADDIEEKFTICSRNVYPPSTSPKEKGHNNNDYQQTRPFKAITGRLIEPLTLNGPLGDFEVFRQNVLAKVNTNIKSTNENMRRRANTTNSQINDPLYLEKRKRNNEAAKRSRDARRRKEDEIAIRCAYLEQERMVLIQENQFLKEELNKYRYGYMMALPKKSV